MVQMAASAPIPPQEESVSLVFSARMGHVSLHLAHEETIARKPNCPKSLAPVMQAISVSRGLKLQTQLIMLLGEFVPKATFALLELTIHKNVLREHIPIPLSIKIYLDVNRVCLAITVMLKALSCHLGIVILDFSVPVARKRRDPQSMSAPQDIAVLLVVSVNRLVTLAPIKMNISKQLVRFVQKVTSVMELFSMPHIVNMGSSFPSLVSLDTTA